MNAHLSIFKKMFMFGEREEKGIFKKGSFLQKYNVANKQIGTHRGDTPLLLHIKSNYR